MRWVDEGSNFAWCGGMGPDFFVKHGRWCCGVAVACAPWLQGATHTQATHLDVAVSGYSLPSIHAPLQCTQCWDACHAGCTTVPCLCTLADASCARTVGCFWFAVVAALVARSRCQPKVATAVSRGQPVSKAGPAFTHDRLASCEQGQWQLSVCTCFGTCWHVANTCWGWNQSINQH